jgi:transcriptional regulator GlxA family with amidase domain
MYRILIIVTPNFNIAATMAFADPFRTANYLSGEAQFQCTFAARDKKCRASNGVSIETQSLDAVQDGIFDMVVVSSSWTPEVAATPQLKAALRRWARKGCMMGAIDTGAFILADAGLLSGHRTTVHYEHIDALKEMHGDIDVSQDIFVADGRRITCCGGFAAADMALHIISSTSGDALANAAARYIFHPKLRAPGTPQNPADKEPVGNTVPAKVRQAIALMELHLENVLPVAELCARMGISQRQLDRLFLRYVGKSPVIYYRDVRLDRARGLVTQTDMLISEIALASGFSSPVHFSRAYKERFTLTPRRDRVAGRIPFEFRAWPMHSP